MMSVPLVCASPRFQWPPRQTAENITFVLPPASGLPPQLPYLDVTGDNQISALDVLTVINFLNGVFVGTVPPAATSGLGTNVAPANGPDGDQPSGNEIAGVTVASDPVVPPVTLTFSLDAGGRSAVGQRHGPGER